MLEKKKCKKDKISQSKYKVCKFVKLFRNMNHNGKIKTNFQPILEQFKSKLIICKGRVSIEKELVNKSCFLP